jgi:integrase
VIGSATSQWSARLGRLRQAPSLASWLLAGGVDIVVVQERLGHRRITTAQQYTGTLPDAGDRTLAAFRKIRYGEPAPETS